MPASTKASTSSPEAEALVQLFTSLGVAPKTAVELVRQPKNGVPFKALIDEYKLEDEKLSEKQASALVKLSTTGGKLGPREKGYVVEKVVKGDLNNTEQVAGEPYASKDLVYGH